jgi:hypothetical protein
MAHDVILKVPCLEQLSFEKVVSGANQLLVDRVNERERVNERGRVNERERVTEREG